MASRCILSMALLHIEGFEKADGIDAYLIRKLPLSVDGKSWAAGRFTGGKSINLQYNDYLGFGIPNTQTIIIGFACRYERADINWAILSIRDGANVHAELRTNAFGRLEFFGDSTLLGTSAPKAIKQGIWHYIEVKVHIHGTAGSYEVRVDGATVISGTGVDTYDAGGGAYVNEIYIFAQRYTIDDYIDDIYICDTVGAYNNDFLGDRRIVAVSPDADGSSTDFAINPDTGEDHYEDVDDGTLPDDDITYVQSATSGQEDLYTFVDFTNIGSILGIQVFTDAKLTDATPYSMITPCRTYSTDHDDAGQAATTSWAIYSRVFDTEPEYSVPWTPTILNQAMFGVKVV